MEKRDSRYLFLISLKVGKLPLYLAASMVFLVILDVIAYKSGLYEFSLFKKYLNPTRERNVPTLISALSFALIAVLLLKWKKKPLALFFFYLSLDDLFMLHEQLGSLLGKAFLKGKIVGYYWHYVFDPIYAFFFLTLLFLVARAVFKEKSDFESLFLILVGFFLIAVSQASDFYEGIVIAKKLPLLREKFLLHALRDVEEALEVLANAFIAFSLVKLTKAENDEIVLSYKLSD